MSGYIVEAFHARSAMGTPYRTPRITKNRLGTLGHDTAHGMYHTPDFALLDPGTKRCMLAAAVSDVMTSDVWHKHDCGSLSCTGQRTPVSMMARRVVTESPTKADATPIEMSSSRKPLPSVH